MENLLNYSENDDVIKLYGAQCDFLILFEVCEVDLEFGVWDSIYSV